MLPVVWSVDTRDYDPGVTAKPLVARVRKALRPGSIILLHDGGGDRREDRRRAPDDPRRDRAAAATAPVTVTQLLNDAPPEQDDLAGPDVTSRRRGDDGRERGDHRGIEAASRRWPAAARARAPGRAPPGRARPAVIADQASAAATMRASIGISSPRQRVGIAGAVVPLVVVADGGWPPAPAPSAADDVGAELDVRAQERARLARSAAVAAARGRGSRACRCRAASRRAGSASATRSDRPSSRRDPAGQVGDLLAVLLRRRLADGHRERQAAGQLEHLGLVGGQLLDGQRRRPAASGRGRRASRRTAPRSAASSSASSVSPVVPHRGAARRRDGQLRAAGQHDRRHETMLRRIVSARRSSVSWSGISGSSTANSSPP